MNEAAVILECESLCKEYQQGNETLHVLKNLGFKLYAGERLAIVGTSGSGKTTLLNMLGGLDIPSSGRVLLAGEEMSSMGEDARAKLRNRSLGFVYQFHHLLSEFSALENVAMPLMMQSLGLSQLRKRAEEMLAAVGLEHRAAHKPSELSGGERQRVAIARALVTRPACVLMDEPTGNLDRETAERIQALMQDLNESSQCSFITVTHDIQLASKMDRTLHMTDGQLVEPHV